MKMKKKILLLTLSCILMIGATACSGKADDKNTSKTSIQETDIFESGEISVGESSYEDKTKPPTISLTDPLLSVITYDNDFSSGSYEWTYRDKKENVSVVACGASPTDYTNESLDELEIANYQNLDDISYMLDINGVKDCDLVVVEEYQINNLESETRLELDPSVIEYKYGDLIKLKKNCIYNIILTWNEENIDTNGFFGKAEYIFKTK